MAAWYIARVNTVLCKICYYLFVFSMVVPFQMLMFTLAKTADTLKLNTPWTIPVIYLGFGAGMAVFMFTGFVKDLPLEIEEAAAIDGCGPVRTFFVVILSMLKPTMISIAILEIRQKVFWKREIKVSGRSANRLASAIRLIFLMCLSNTRENCRENISGNYRKAKDQ